MDAEAPPPLIAEPASDAAQRSLVEDARRLVDDGRTLLEAELAYHKARAAVAGEAAREVAAWGALALALVFFALMALVMGVLLGIAQLVGYWAATAIVVAALVLVAGLAAARAAARWKRASAQISEPKPVPEAQP
ncbi:MAG TPA: phage holin family protein [Novosphingobium sp.]|nr:phage holin family protein [Novosphingobium sp.]